MLNKLYVKATLYYYEVIKELNSITVYNEYFLSTLCCITMDSITLKNQGKLNLNNDINIPKLLFQLKQEYRDKYNNIKDIFFKLFPNIIGLTVKETELVGNFRISIPYIKENTGYYLSVQDINMK